MNKVKLREQWISIVASEQQWVSFLADYDTSQFYPEISMKLTARSEHEWIPCQKVLSFILKCHSIVKLLGVFLVLRLKWHFLKCVFHAPFRWEKLSKWTRKQQQSEEFTIWPRSSDQTNWREVALESKACFQFSTLREPFKKSLCLPQTAKARNRSLFF